jgi:hypothetical protein
MISPSRLGMSLSGLKFFPMLEDCYPITRNSRTMTRNGSGIAILKIQRLILDIVGSQ